MNSTLTLTQEWDKTFPQNDAVDHCKVTFHNRFGIELAADLYKPKGAQGPFAAVAVSGPFGAVKEQCSGLYAQELAARGFLTVAFDPSYTGESGGTPRYVASPDINTEDFSAAVDFLSVRDDVDPERIGILGICGWGGMALNAAAIDTRMFAMTDLNSLSEAIELAEVTGCRMIVSHFEYQYGVGVEYKALEMLELARARGVDMRLDSGMYKDWCSSIGSALFEPVTMRDNGIELRHLRVITGEHIGLVPDQALYEHLRAAHPCDAVVVNTGSEEAVYTIQRYPMTMVSTDTGSYAPGEGHPQIAGSFPRYLRKMVIERGELSWEQAIAHTTLLPAQTMGLGRKGRIRAGMDADLLVFDPETICDRADFPGLGRPDAAPEGIRFVIVSGEIAAENGRATGVMAGKTLNSFDFIHSSRRAMAGD